MKHVQSIALAVRTGKYAWAWETEGGEGLKQRIADARNYLLLLAACLEAGSGSGLNASLPWGPRKVTPVELVR
jgi:hypothetical protein